MEGPKQIYVPKSHLEVQITKGNDSHVKHIRADLAELSWQDVRILCDSFMRKSFTFIGNIKRKKDDAEK